VPNENHEEYDNESDEEVGHGKMMVTWKAQLRDLFLADSWRTIALSLTDSV
jgi:hypothetical protein